MNNINISKKKIIANYNTEFFLPTNAKRKIKMIIPGPFDSPVLAKTTVNLDENEDRCKCNINSYGQRQISIDNTSCFVQKLGIPDPWIDYVTYLSLKKNPEMEVFLDKFMEQKKHHISVIKALYKSHGLAPVQGIPNPYRIPTTRDYNKIKDCKISPSKVSANSKKLLQLKDNPWCNVPTMNNNSSLQKYGIDKLNKFNESDNDALSETELFANILTVDELSIDENDLNNLKVLKKSSCVIKPSIVTNPEKFIVRKMESCIQQHKTELNISCIDSPGFVGNNCLNAPCFISNNSGNVHNITDCKTSGIAETDQVFSNYNWGQNNATDGQHCICNSNNQNNMKNNTIQTQTESDTCNTHNNYEKLNINNIINSIKATDNMANSNTNHKCNCDTNDTLLILSGCNIKKYLNYLNSDSCISQSVMNFNYNNNAGSLNDSSKETNNEALLDNSASEFNEKLKQKNIASEENNQNLIQKICNIDDKISDHNTISNMGNNDNDNNDILLKNANLNLSKICNKKIEQTKLDNEGYPNMINEKYKSLDSCFTRNNRTLASINLQQNNANRQSKDMPSNKISKYTANYNNEIKNMSHDSVIKKDSSYKILESTSSIISIEAYNRDENDNKVHTEHVSVESEIQSSSSEEIKYQTVNKVRKRKPLKNTDHAYDTIKDNLSHQQFLKIVSSLKNITDNLKKVLKDNHNVRKDKNDKKSSYNKINKHKAAKNIDDHSLTRNENDSYYETGESEPSIISIQLVSSSKKSNQSSISEHSSSSEDIKYQNVDHNKERECNKKNNKDRISVIQEENNTNQEFQNILSFIASNRDNLKNLLKHNDDAKSCDQIKNKEQGNEINESKSSIICIQVINSNKKSKHINDCKENKNQKQKKNIDHDCVIKKKGIVESESLIADQSSSCEEIICETVNHKKRRIRKRMPNKDQECASKNEYQYPEYNNTITFKINSELNSKKSEEENQNLSADKKRNQSSKAKQYNSVRSKNNYRDQSESSTINKSSTINEFSANCSSSDKEKKPKQTKNKEQSSNNSQKEKLSNYDFLNVIRPLVDSRPSNKSSIGKNQQIKTNNNPNRINNQHNVNKNETDSNYESEESKVSSISSQVLNSNKKKDQKCTSSKNKGRKNVGKTYNGLKDSVSSIISSSCSGIQTSKRNVKDNDTSTNDNTSGAALQRKVIKLKDPVKTICDYGNKKRIHKRCRKDDNASKNVMRDDLNTSKELPNRNSNLCKKEDRLFVPKYRNVVNYSNEVLSFNKRKNPTTVNNNDSKRSRYDVNVTDNTLSMSDKISTDDRYNSNVERNKKRKNQQKKNNECNCNKNKHKHVNSEFYNCASKNRKHKVMVSSSNEDNVLPNVLKDENSNPIVVKRSSNKRRQYKGKSIFDMKNEHTISLHPSQSIEDIQQHKNNNTLVKKLSIKENSESSLIPSEETVNVNTFTRSIVSAGNKKRCTCEIKENCSPLCSQSDNIGKRVRLQLPK